MQRSTALLLSESKAARNQHLGNWGAYAAAAGAALAMSTNASAEIVYSGPVDLTVSVAVGGGLATHPLSIAGVHQLLVVQNKISPNSGTALISNGLTHGPPPPELRFFGKESNGDNVARNYALAQEIAGGASVNSLGAVLRVHNGSNNAGAFGPGTVTGFVGFKVSSGANTGDLGWVQVKVSDSGSPGYPNELEVIDYAYNNVAGTSIKAGDTGVSATPEPGTAALGLLAFGALGVLALRRRRNEVAVK
jgi:MYXO-CTERM domain-containing protein